MNTAGLIRYSRCRLDAIAQYLRRSIRGIAAEDIHELRVEIKRLRVLVGLLGWSDRRLGASGLMRPVRRLFRAAGGLRDLHIQRNLVQAYAREPVSRLGELINHLQQQETRARDRYLIVGAQFDPEHLGVISRALAAPLKRLPTDELSWKTEQRLAVSLSRLADLRDERSLADADLHRIRMMCKEARYTLEACQNAATPLPQDHEELNQQLRRCHQALGQWHDALIGSEYLQRFLSQDALRPLTDESAYDDYQVALQQRAEKQLESFGARWIELMDRLGRQPTQEATM